MPRDWISATEAGRLLGISAVSFQRFATATGLRSYKVARRVYWSRRELEASIRSLMDAEAARAEEYRARWAGDYFVRAAAEQAARAAEYRARWASAVQAAQSSRPPPQKRPD